MMQRKMVARVHDGLGSVVAPAALVEVHRGEPSAPFLKDDGVTPCPNACLVAVIAGWHVPFEVPIICRSQVASVVLVYWSSSVGVVSAACDSQSAHGRVCFYKMG